jgi:phage terminase large subunit
LGLIPKRFKDRLVARLLESYRAAVANEQREEAEKAFRKEQGERASTTKERAKCARSILHWFKAWVWTYDPRLVGKIDPKTKKTLSPFIRFILWPKQALFVTWVVMRIRAGEPWLLEKSRDQGATYLLAAICLWFWLFTPGFKATFGSRGADEVDSRDNPDSIFEKMRIILRRLPTWMLPAGFDWRKHDNIMQLTNPENGATITGEAGDDIGRGGRCTVLILDEAAFIARVGKVEAAASGTTDCVGWVSTVNPQEGMGNFFARKRHAMPQRLIWRLHWRDDPRKSDAWAEAKKASLSDPITWEAEYEINYTANAAGVCIPAAWVRSAQLLADLLPEIPRGRIGISGGDVGGGKALSVVVHRFGPIVLTPESRKEGDTDDTAKWMMRSCAAVGSGCVNFDSPGVGAGVVSTMTKAQDDADPEIADIATKLVRNAVNTGVPASGRIWPDDRTSEEMFGNLKAELWWLARQAFQRAHWHWLYLTKAEGGRAQSESEIVILPNSMDVETMTLVSQLSLPKYKKNDKGKIVLESKDSLAKRSIPSPDHADAFVLSFLEPPDDGMAGVQLDVTTFAVENRMRIGGIGDG